MELERGRRTAPSPVYVAALYAALGDHDAAFRWLEREQWIGRSKIVLRTLPSLDSLRSDARFARVLRRLSLARRPRRCGPGPPAGWRLDSRALSGGRCQG